MKLCSLWLPDYGVLRDFEIHFAPKHNVEQANPLQFVVGLNGSGKSSILRAISQIFYQLESQARVDFPFQMIYRLGPGRDNLLVELAGTGPDAELKVWVNGEPGTFSVSLLPDQIVAFTSGREAEWLEETRHTGTVATDDEGMQLRDKPVDHRFSEELPGSGLYLNAEDAEASAQARVMLVRSSRMALTFLCGWLADVASQASRLQKALKEAHVADVTGFSLRLHVGEGTLTRPQTQLINKLKGLSRRQISQGPELLLVFDLEQVSSRTCRRLLALDERQLGLYRTLDSLMDPRTSGALPIVKELNVFIRRLPNVTSQDNGPKVDAHPLLHLFDWLSDGEQDFLGRMALFAMLEGTEALILIDEPEVHFNDQWKRYVVYVLEEALANSHSHAVVATHSSITLSDVKQNQVRLLRRGATHTNRAVRAPIQTYGADPSSIMVYVFDAPYPTGFQVEHQVLEEVVHNPGLSKGKRDQLLRRLLPDVAPGYWNYYIRQLLRGPEDSDDPPDEPTAGR